MVRVGSLGVIDSNVTVVTTTHPPVLQTHPPTGLHTQVIVVADSNTKLEVYIRIRLNYILIISLIYLFILNCSKVEKKDEVVVINSSQADDDLDASHVSVITVGEESSVKKLDSWKNKEVEISKPICVPVSTATDSNKVKMNGHPSVVKSNDPAEVYIVVNNSTNVHKMVILFRTF